MIKVIWLCVQNINQVLVTDRWICLPLNSVGKFIKTFSGIKKDDRRHVEFDLLIVVTEFCNFDNERVFFVLQRAIALSIFHLHKQRQFCVIFLRKIVAKFPRLHVTALKLLKNYFCRKHNERKLLRKSELVVSFRSFHFRLTSKVSFYLRRRTQQSTLLCVLFE